MRANRVAAACCMLLLLAAVQARTLNPTDPAHGELQATRAKRPTLAGTLSRHLPWAYPLPRLPDAARDWCDAGTTMDSLLARQAQQVSLQQAAAGAATPAAAWESASNTSATVDDLVDQWEDEDPLPDPLGLRPLLHTVPVSAPGGLHRLSQPQEQCS
jgi:hypothetical protein